MSEEPYKKVTFSKVSQPDPKPEKAEFLKHGTVSPKLQIIQVESREFLEFEGTYTITENKSVAQNFV